MNNIPRSTRLALTAVALGVASMFGAFRGHDIVSSAHAADSPAALAGQAACKSTQPASTGGPMPEGDTVVLRWLGTSNYEVAYHGKVILMDTFYDRPARTRSIGLTVDQFRRADAILIGHAHYDHITDVAPVAAQTGAPVLGSAISTTAAQALGVPAARTISVKGDNTERFRYGDITVQPTHIVHSSIEPGLIPALANLYNVDGLGPLTPAEQAQNNASRSRGSSDPNIVAQGTMGFTLTLASGFTIVWFDSVGGILPEEQALAAQLGSNVDVALFPYTPHPIAETQISYTMPHIALFKPKLYLPTHHDHIWGAWLDNGLQPLFMKIRDEQPGTSFTAPLYRSAICIATSGSNRGQFIVKN
jgi:L-ascorbate metabolism protein UlaG (beta-lactamase superfamily)